MATLGGSSGKSVHIRVVTLSEAKGLSLLVAPRDSFTREMLRPAQHDRDVVPTWWVHHLTMREIHGNHDVASGRQIFAAADPPAKRGLMLPVTSSLQNS